ncbi:Sec-independent protein translocase subunit TatA [Microbacterium sp.]|uniref:Sec-independent protein translocase subunit TatA n=1 Tax=Microbacterium sp. TaxID=51671 RepID=UPI0039E6512C
MGAFGWPHLLIILAVIILLFGAAKLPALAKSLGQSARVFKGEIKAMKDEEASDVQATTSSPAAPAAPDSTAPSGDEGQPPRSA